jgi:hypothetical protein
MRHTGNRIGGSNPSLSAIMPKQRTDFIEENEIKGDCISPSMSPVMRAGLQALSVSRFA